MSTSHAPPVPTERPENHLRPSTPCPTAESQILDLIAASSENHSVPVSAAHLLSLYDSLGPLTPSELIGEWSASSFNTGHPAHPWLKSINWVGIRFWSVDDVEPIVVAVTTENKNQNNGVSEKVWSRKKWMEEFGNGQVIEAKFRDVVSATMVCDDHPILNYYRKVSDTVVLGVMVAKMFHGSGLFLFYLTR
ncbi:transcription factor cmr1 protein [Diplodia corticola]|uniref:Transcription factor cmr1 protein n=1 Tax=Diplodia corticola TaxID=236234 RepID=A0A1J9RDI1_9PEZI|nr:transcription factor cmr1 protein [Diplodia corticola]OJD30603.1 transcription factor cmr1 protein [Diplodia corticola]